MKKKLSYQNGKIYQVLNSEDKECYVGSTCQLLSKRLSKHKADMNVEAKQHFKLYQHMKVLGADKFYIELIENYPCKTKEELLAREGHFIRERGTLNKTVQGRTSAQYWKDNQEQRSANCKEWRKSNIPKLKQYEEKRKEKVQCECGDQIAKRQITKHRQSARHQNNLTLNEVKHEE